MDSGPASPPEREERRDPFRARPFGGQEPGKGVQRDPDKSGLHNTRCKDLEDAQRPGPVSRPGTGARQTVARTGSRRGRETGRRWGACPGASGPRKAADRHSGPRARQLGAQWRDPARLHTAGAPPAAGSVPLRRPRQALARGAAQGCGAKLQPLQRVALPAAPLGARPPRGCDDGRQRDRPSTRRVDAPGREGPAVWGSHGGAGGPQMRGGGATRRMS